MDDRRGLAAINFKALFVIQSIIYGHLSQTALSNENHIPKKLFYYFFFTNSPGHNLVIIQSSTLLSVGVVFTSIIFYSRFLEEFEDFQSAVAPFFFLVISSWTVAPISSKVHH